MYIQEEVTREAGHSLGGKQNPQGNILEVPGFFCVGRANGDPRHSIGVQVLALGLFHLGVSLLLHSLSQGEVFGAALCLLPTPVRAQLDAEIPGVGFPTTPYLQGQTSPRTKN